MMTHPLWLAQNLTTHPFVRAQNLVTHPPSAPIHPPPILIDQSLIIIINPLPSPKEMMKEQRNKNVPF